MHNLNNGLLLLRHLQSPGQNYLEMNQLVSAEQEIMFMV